VVGLAAGIDTIALKPAIKSGAPTIDVIRTLLLGRHPREKRGFTEHASMPTSGIS